MIDANRIIRRLCNMLVGSIWSFTLISIYFLISGLEIKEALSGAFYCAFFIWLFGSIIVIVTTPKKKDTHQRNVSLGECEELSDRKNSPDEIIFPGEIKQ